MTVCPKCGKDRSTHPEALHYKTPFGPLVFEPCPSVPPGEVWHLDKPVLSVVMTGVTTEPPLDSPAPTVRK